MSNKAKPSVRAKRAPKPVSPRGFGIIEVEGVPPETVFRFQLGPAILDQLRTKLLSLEPVPLEDEPYAPYPGFYQIIFDGEPKYIGKTDRTVGARLGEHRKTFGRLRVPLERLTCRYAFVEDLSLVEMSEGSLIRYFRERNEAEWNGTGLGSKVSGFGRRGQKASKFRELFKPNLRQEITAGGETMTLRNVVKQIDAAAPVFLKIPTKFGRRFDQEFAERLPIPAVTRPFNAWVRWLERKLGPNWRIEREAMSWYIVPE